MVEQGGGGGPKKKKKTQNKTHWKADWRCIGLGDHSQHFLQNRWDLYATLFMGTATVQVLDNEKSCARQKTKHSTQPTAPCVQTCTQSHDKHTFLTVQASELAYMSLYIIYLYLVKNKLHNSTNLENCFFKLKIT